MLHWMRALFSMPEDILDRSHALFVRRLGKALERRRLHDCFAESHNWVSDLQKEKRVITEQEAEAL